MTEEDEARIAARYPKRSPLDLILGGAVGIGVLGMIVLVILNALQQANPPVVAQIRDFEVLSTTKIFTRVVVQREDPSLPAKCRVYAQAESYEVVAEQIIEVPPAENTLSTVETTLSTIKEATAVRVDQCSLVG